MPYRINALAPEAADPALACFSADLRSKRRRAGLVCAAAMALLTTFVAAPLVVRHDVSVEPAPKVYRMKFVLRVPGECAPREACDF